MAMIPVSRLASRGCVLAAQPRTALIRAVVGVAAVLASVLAIARPAAGQQLYPFVDSYEEDLANELTVSWSWVNTTGSQIDIFIGPQNVVDPGVPFQGQPVVFPPGRTVAAFEIAYGGSVTREWRLNNSIARLERTASGIRVVHDFADGTAVAISDSAGLTSIFDAHAGVSSGFALRSDFELIGDADLTVAADGVLWQAGGALEVDEMTIDAGGRWVYTNGMADLGTGLSNAGSAVFIGVTIEDPVHNEAGSTSDIVGDVTFTAPVSGPGAFFGSGTAHFDGGYSPGASPAVVEHENSIAFGSGNMLTIELAGTALGEFDRLVTEADAMLDGTLDVDLIDGFTLALNQQFEILNVAGTQSGQFLGLGQDDLVGNFGGTDLFISYTAGDGNDVALYTAVPEPASLALLGMGGGLLLIRRRVRNSFPVPTGNE